jgi:hypothetical protein
MDLHIHFTRFNALKRYGVDMRDGHSAPNAGQT